MFCYRGGMSASSRARARVRAELTQEILAAAHEELAAGGAAGLSLRAVARRLEMVPSALYRYFPNRDALLTALIVDAYEAVGAAAGAADAAALSAGANRRAANRRRANRRAADRRRANRRAADRRRANRRAADRRRANRRAADRRRANGPGPLAGRRSRRPATGPTATPTSGRWCTDPPCPATRRRARPSPRR